MGFRVQGSGFRVQGSGFKVQGSRFRVQGSGFRVQGVGLGGTGWRRRRDGAWSGGKSAMRFAPEMQHNRLWCPS